MKKYYGWKRPTDNESLDQYIHEHYIKNPFYDGTFLELGALNGIDFNNTKFFEDKMGFNRGVLIEPDLKSFIKLVKNRPNCENLNYAVHSEKKSVEFLVSTKAAAINCMAYDECSKIIRDEFHNSPEWKKYSKLVIIPSERLDTLLQKTKLKYIDLWILDVEGSELECLNSMDWSIPIGLVVVEITSNRKEIHDIMTERGLTLIETRNNHDSFYFNFNYFRKNLFSNF